MAEIQIKAETLPERCEICHRADCFNAQTGFCSRCSKILSKNNNLLKTEQPVRFSTLLNIREDEPGLLIRTATLLRDMLNSNMKLTRFFAFLLAIITIKVSIYVYLEYIYWLGFPDSYITELGFAERKLAYIIITVNFILGSFFVYLGFTSSKKYQGIKLLISIVLYIVIIICISFIDHNYQSYMDHGQGG